MNPSETFDGTLDANDERAIRNLLHIYAERVDSGDFDGVSALFAEAQVFMAGPDRPAVPGPMVGRVMARFVMLHDGSPRTKHLVDNTVIEPVTIDEVRTRSVFTVMQAVPGLLPLQAVASGRYHDRFVRGDDGAWRFAERTMLVDAHGDVSQHLVGSQPPRET